MNVKREDSKTGFPNFLWLLKTKGVFNELQDLVYTELDALDDEIKLIFKYAPSTAGL